ncbi:hypothetical protein [Luteimonas changyuni]|uniref:hypothetical protein n=1 Tax=Luteimonas sp. MJ145 TaxID=3129234 RepID=UPI0031B9B766
MDARLISMLLVLALPLAACEHAAPPPEAVAADDHTSAAASNRTLPAGFVVLTNEPFWQARVEAGAVVLSGPDLEGRRLAIATDNEVEGARLVHASDDAGTIAVTLTPGPCEDSMSGAVFPQVAELVIDGIGPVSGCARPAGTPPPAPSGL